MESMNRGLTRRWLAFLVAIVSTMSCRGLGPQDAAVSMPGRALVADTLRLVTLRDTVVVSRTSAWLDPTGDYVISTRLDADTVASLRTRVRFDGSDRPVLIVTAGADVTGQRVEERFWRTPSGASWRNRLEAGDTIGAEASIYVPLDHAKMLIMLPALLSSRGHPLRL